MPDLYTPGKFYRMPVVKADWMGRVGEYVVMGPEHDDADYIGFELPHWHVHPQFCTEYGLKLNETSSGKTVPRWVHAVLAPSSEGYTPLEIEPEYVGLRLRKCRRPMPEYSVVPPWSGELSAAMRDRPLKLDHPVCPHKGADLSCVPVRDGVITCPLHGLRFDASTGCVHLT